MENIKNSKLPSEGQEYKKAYSFMNRHPVIPSLNINNALKLMSAFYRQADAVDCLDLKVSFQDLIDNAAILAKGLKELGVKENDIIAVSMSNYYQAVVTFFAANQIGATTTFLNSHSSIEEIEYYLNTFETPVLLNFNKSQAYNERIKKNTKVRQVITLAPQDLNVSRFNEQTMKTIGYSDYLSFNDMKLVGDFYKDKIKTNYGGNQNALILFTSGTTGNPKAVVLTNQNIMASGMYMKSSTNLDKTIGEKSLVCVPFCYPYGFVTSTLMSLLCGRVAVLAPDLSKDNINYYLSKDPNIIFGSPALLELIKRNVEEGKNLSSIHTFISGGDFLNPYQNTKGTEFFREHGSDVKMCNGFGNAETVGASTNAVGQAIKPETVGKILAGTDVIILNEETNQELGYGEEGHICIAGKHIFKEYFNDPEKTQEAKFEYKGKTYLKTGTRGILDKEGYITLTGRDSRFYIMSTLNKVYCDHVQTIMSAIDVVESCAVVKKPHDELLYTSKAFVVLKEGVEPTEETIKYIKEKCEEQLIMPITEEIVQLKDYEIPTSFSFVDALPRRQGSDKIDYQLLEEDASKEYQSEKSNILVRKKVVEK